MQYTSVFKRYEIKFLLTLPQKDAILRAMEPHMMPDRHGRSTIRNIYFDTDSYRLIRHSLEKPIYKEKLRLRSYQTATAETPIFVELKKKYKKVVYKRRLKMPEADASAWLCNGGESPQPSQIADEIEYFRTYYEALHPTMFLAYDREAYFAKDTDDFRVTFDSRILARQEALSLTEEAWGTPILPEETVLMELKCGGGIPLWMTHTLSEEKLYKTSFSKYGIAYQTIILPSHKGGHLYV